MQLTTGLAKKRAENKKNTRLFQAMEWKTIRFLLINRAGRIAWNNGSKVLQMTKNLKTKELYEKISNSLSDIQFKKAA
ncbi:MAG: hypothetical protein P1P89_04605 [Desulfobacterales bacterium]|nr:hypothetical protein [Desulfobacterales bacterium]